MSSTPCFFLSTPPCTPAISTLSLHDALPICYASEAKTEVEVKSPLGNLNWSFLSLPFLWPLFKSAREKYETSTEAVKDGVKRSEEHTSELQSPYDLVCRLLLEKKNKITRS